MISAENSGAPAVGVVIPTRNRPDLLRRAIDSVISQDYPGPIEIVVVYDGAEPDASLERSDPLRSVRAIRNSRMPGLSGARNTGMLALTTPYVASCDDDDYWLPGKLDRQITRAQGPDRPEMVSSSITVEYDGQRHDRLAGTDTLTLADLTRSIHAMAHSSSYLWRREALIDMGLFNEEVPGGQCEDWDIKLRAAARQPIAHVDEPLTVVQWGRTSMFNRQWGTKNAAHEWMLEHHPEIVADRKGAARVYGQLAFGNAAEGNRRTALGWTWRTFGNDPTQFRWVLALAVVAWPPLSGRIMDLLHRFGRGI